MKRGRESDAAEKGDLRSLWREATSRPIHGSHCSCCGGGLVQFGAHALEVEILEFLISKYTDRGEALVVQFLTLLQKENIGDLIDRFERHAPTSGLTSKAMAQLTSDIVSILSSMTNQTGSSFSSN